MLHAGVPGFESGEGQEFCLLESSKPALRPIQAPIECVKGALLQGIKWPGRETDHSPLSTAKCENDYTGNTIYMQS